MIELLFIYLLFFFLLIFFRIGRIEVFVIILNAEDSGAALNDLINFMFPISASYVLLDILIYRVYSFLMECYLRI